MDKRSYDIRISGDGSEPALSDDIVSQQSGDEWLTDYENDYKGGMR